MLPALEELGIGLVPFCPLGRGFLTGNVRRAEEYTAQDSRQFDPRFHGENFDANMKAVQIVRNIADSIGAKPSQVALAWLLAKPVITIIRKLCSHLPSPQPTMLAEPGTPVPIVIMFAGVGVVPPVGAPALTWTFRL